MAPVCLSARCTEVRDDRDATAFPVPDDHVLVIFGATGDLAKRKLLPGLWHLANAGLLPNHFRIVGSAPAQYAVTDEQFRQHAKDAVDRVRLGASPRARPGTRSRSSCRSAPPTRTIPHRW